MFKNYSLNVIAQFLGRAFSIGAQLFVFILIARRFGVEFVGKYAYFLTFVNVCATFADFGTNVTATKDLPRFHGEQRRRYWGSVFLIRGSLVVVTMGLACVALLVLRDDMRTTLLIGVCTIPFAA